MTSAATGATLSGSRSSWRGVWALARDPSTYPRLEVIDPIRVLTLTPATSSSST